MDDLKRYLASGNEIGRIAIYDGSNTTKKSREWVMESVRPLVQSSSHLIFIESICNDEAAVEANINDVQSRLIIS